MQTWEFTITLADTGLTDDQVDALYGMASDASCGSCAGVWSIDFDRDAESLETAIRSAIADTRKAGLTPKRIELETESLAAKV